MISFDAKFNHMINFPLSVAITCMQPYKCISIIASQYKEFLKQKTDFLYVSSYVAV